MTFLLALLLSEYTFYILLGLAVISSSSNFYRRDYISGGSAFLFILAIGLFIAGHYSHISPFLLMIILPTYLIAGLVWSIVKWRLHVKESILDYQQLVEEAPKIRKYANEADCDHTRRVEELKASYLENLKRESNTSQQKHRIKSWIAVWPVSLVITCSYNAIDHIYNEAVGWFNGITAKLFKNASIPV